MLIPVFFTFLWNVIWCLPSLNFIAAYFIHLITDWAEVRNLCMLIIIIMVWGILQCVLIIMIMVWGVLQCGLSSHFSPACSAGTAFVFGVQLGLMSATDSAYQWGFCIKISIAWELILRLVSSMILLDVCTNSFYPHIHIVMPSTLFLYSFFSFFKYFSQKEFPLYHYFL